MSAQTREPHTTPSTEERALISAALAARDHAYAPYSNFHVGAAIVDDAGAVHAGCNVENAAYPQGQCAEASAIGAMIAAGGRRIVKIVVVGPDDAPCAPCGGCRQRISEFARPTTEILLASDGVVHSRRRIDDLLPGGFQLDPKPRG